MNFTKENLEEYLLSLEVPLELWGKDKAKIFDHLLSELEKRECRLNGICRKVNTVVLDVFHKNLRLKESCQVFNDGRIRQRILPWGAVGEKLTQGEKIIHGFRRALKEELGILNSYGIKISPLRSNVLVNLSDSYPGLLTINFQSRFRVILPKRLYRPDGYFENQSDKVTYFDWEEIKSQNTNE